MYDPMMVQPMRDEVTRIGMTEMRTAEEVEKQLNAPGTAFVFINSVCGCAAGGARPALKMAFQNAKKPERLTTAFAGNDVEAVAKARSYFTGFPPSSPQFAIIKDGKLAWIMERWQIEGRPPESIAAELVQVFNAL
jgi:putative YphP/YqiW family bacilliredoxin